MYLKLLPKHNFDMICGPYCFGDIFNVKETWILWVWLRQHMLWTSQLLSLFTRLSLNLVLSFLKPPKACFPVFVFVQWKLDSVFWKQKVENTSQITITLVGPTIFGWKKHLLKTAYPNISISHSQPFKDRYIGGEWYVGFKPHTWSTIIKVIFL